MRRTAPSARQRVLPFGAMLCPELYRQSPVPARSLWTFRQQTLPVGFAGAAVLSLVVEVDRARGRGLPVVDAACPRRRRLLL